MFGVAAIGADGHAKLDTQLVEYTRYRRLRYRVNVISGEVMVIVGVVWPVALATRYRRNADREVRATSRSRLLLRIDNSDRGPSVAVLP